MPLDAETIKRLTQKKKAAPASKPAQGRVIKRVVYHSSLITYVERELPCHTCSAFTHFRVDGISFCEDHVVAETTKFVSLYGKMLSSNGNGENGDSYL